MSEHKVQSEQHALVTGYLIGTLMRKGISAAPVVDDHGNYTAQIDITFPDDIFRDERLVRVSVIVLPPEV